jgi:hypothetical protein
MLTSVPITDNPANEVSQRHDVQAPSACRPLLPNPVPVAMRPWSIGFWGGQSATPEQAVKVDRQAFAPSHLRPVAHARSTMQQAAKAVPQIQEDTRHRLLLRRPAMRHL